VRKFGGGGTSGRKPSRKAMALLRDLGDVAALDRTEMISDTLSMLRFWINALEEHGSSDCDCCAALRDDMILSLAYIPERYGEAL
jgi:hypothetical protein